MRHDTRKHWLSPRYILEEFSCFFGAFCNNKWNLDPWLCTGNETAVKTVNWSRRTGSKKAKNIPSTGKVMASVFWDAKRIMLIDHLEKRKTIIEEYYLLQGNNREYGEMLDQVRWTSKRLCEKIMSDTEVRLLSITSIHSRVKFERETSINVCMAAIGLRREKFVWRFLLWKKNLNNEFAWNFVFPMKLRLRNHWKCSRSVLGGLLYREKLCSKTTTPAWLWLKFWLNTKRKSFFSHRIRQIWLPGTFSCSQNSNNRSEKCAMSRLRP